MGRGPTLMAHFHIKLSFFKISGPEMNCADFDFGVVCPPKNPESNRNKSEAILLKVWATRVAIKLQKCAAKKYTQCTVESQF